MANNLKSEIEEKRRRLTDRYQALMGFSDHEIGLIANMYSKPLDGWEEFDLEDSRGREAAERWLDDNFPALRICGLVDRFVVHNSSDSKKQQHSLQYILEKIKPYISDKNVPDIRDMRLYNLEGGIEHFVNKYPPHRNVSDDIVIDWLLADEPNIIPHGPTSSSRFLPDHDSNGCWASAVQGYETHG